MASLSHSFHAPESPLISFLLYYLEVVKFGKLGAGGGAVVKRLILINLQQDLAGRRYFLLRYLDSCEKRALQAFVGGEAHVRVELEHVFQDLHHFGGYILKLFLKVKGVFLGAGGLLW